MKTLKAIDICAGAGGWACAARGLPVDIVLAVDLWQPACKTYGLNHPWTRVMQADLRDPTVQSRIISAARRFGVDLILGGIPCEWLSSYRILQKVGAAELEAQRATLDSALDLVRKIDPKFWCMEDVKALARELPPMTPWNEINARNYSCQRRKRIFVGTFPLPPVGRNTETLAAKLRPGPYRIGRRAFGRTPQLSRTFNGQTTLAALPDRKSPTIMSTCSRRDAEMVVVDPRLLGGIRQMEWQEMAAIQGFPDDYLFYGSPTDVCKQIGRAVQIDLAREILRAICAKWETQSPAPRKAKRKLQEVAQ